jgi:hypothetical protein
MRGILGALIGFWFLTTPAWASVVQVDGGSKGTPMADVTVTGSATLVKAATPLRMALNCTNTSGSVHVRWGDATVTATTGQQLRASSAIEIKHNGTVYMISEGANVTVSCTEELQ